MQKHNSSKAITRKQHKYSVMMVATSGNTFQRVQRVNFNIEDKSGCIVSDKFPNNNACNILNNESNRVFRIWEKLE